MKICHRCKINKDKKCFGKNSNSQDGLRNECKDCRKLEYQLYRQKTLERGRIYYQENKERFANYYKKYRLEKKEEILAYHKKFYNENKTRINRERKEYRDKNIDYVRWQKRQCNRGKKKEDFLKEQEYKKNLITVNYPDNYKICSKCGYLKKICEQNFSIYNKKEKIFFRSYCKDCEKQICKNYRNKNIDKLRKRDRQKYHANKEYHANRKRKYRKTKGGRARIKAYRNRVDVRIADIQRTAINMAVKELGMIKSKSSLRYLGCDMKFFLEHLENNFKEGMTWENRGVGYKTNGHGQPVYDSNSQVIKLKQWVIDHFIPCRAFDLTKEEECDLCFSYKNQWPEWASENCSKQDYLPNGKMARQKQLSLEEKRKLIEDNYNLRTSNFHRANPLNPSYLDGPPSSLIPSSY